MLECLIIGDSIAVGPLQTMICLAIKNGHLPELEAYDKGYDDGYDRGRWTD